MRETGPIRIRMPQYTGEAARYIGLARKYLGMTKNIMRLNKLDQTMRAWQLPDGTYIRVMSVFGQDTVEIIPAFGGEQKFRGACPTMLSGLAHPESGGFIVVFDNEGNVDRLCCPFPIDSGCKPTGTENQACVYRSWYPSADFAAKNEAPREWQTTRKLVGNGAQIYQPMYPGMFSGKMRKVVQDHLSRGFRVPYSPNWSKTHGIYTASDGVLWIIELSSSGAKAKKLEVCKTVDPRGRETALAVDADNPAVTGLDWIYQPTSMVGALSLEVDDTYTEAYTYSPIFPECGWALSESGAKAANVVLGSHSEPPYSYPEALLYELTISEDSETKAPKSVSCSKTLGGIWYGNRLTHFKYPSYFQGTLVSFDWYGVKPAPAADHAEQLIHVWYEGESLQRIEHHHYDLYSDQTYDSGRDYISYSTMTESAWVDCFSSPPLGEVQNHAASGDEVYLSSEIFAAGYFHTDPGSPGGWWRYGTFQPRHTDNNAELSTTYRDVVVIPFGDREGVYHLRRKRDADIATRGQVGQLAIRFSGRTQWEGSFLSEPPDVCVNPPDAYANIPVHTEHLINEDDNYPILDVWSNRRYTIYQKAAHPHKFWNPSHCWAGGAQTADDICRTITDALHGDELGYQYVRTEQYGTLSDGNILAYRGVYKNDAGGDEEKYAATGTQKAPDWYLIAATGERHDTDDYYSSPQYTASETYTYEGGAFVGGQTKEFEFDDAWDQWSAYLEQGQTQYAQINYDAAAGEKGFYNTAPHLADFDGEGDYPIAEAGVISWWLGNP